MFFFFTMMCVISTVVVVHYNFVRGFSCFTPLHTVLMSSFLLQYVQYCTVYCPFKVARKGGNVCKGKCILASLFPVCLNFEFTYKLFHFILPRERRYLQANICILLGRGKQGTLCQFSKLLYL